MRQSTKTLCRNLKDNPNVAENMAKVAAERQALQLLISNALNELDVFRKVQPLIEFVMAQEAAEVQMKQTIEHERTTTSTVRQLRNDLKDEKVDHEEKVRGHATNRGAGDRHGAEDDAGGSVGINAGWGSLALSPLSLCC